MRRLVRIGIIAVFVSLVAVTPAGAAEHLIRTTTTVSGATVASEVLRQLRSVEVGSEGVTMTVETLGGENDIAVGYTGLLGAGDETGDGGKSGELVPWVALAVAGGGFLRILRFLMRLGG